MRAPRLVAVLNVTPDSFSHTESEAAMQNIVPSAILDKAQQLITAGAQVLDVGAESTRPGATPLSAAQEWQRLAPVWQPLVQLCRAHNTRLSLDSYHPHTVAQALEIGCDWVNDVTGFQQPDMLKTVQNYRCKLVVMHSLTIPVQKHMHLPENTNIAYFMRDWIKQTTQRLQSAGIAPERLIIDPGLGFGKTAQQSLNLLLNTEHWRSNLPLFIGHSRKSFLSLFTHKPAHQRDCLTRLCSAQLAAQGVEYLRVHDIAGHAQLFSQLATSKKQHDH